MSATVGTPSISSPFRLVPKTAPVYPDANRLCRDTNPNFPGWLDAPATTTPRGSKSALNCSSDGRRRRRGVAGTAADGRSSTRASTATGRPSAPMISGLTSTLATSSRSLITRPTATRAATSSSRLTAGSPRNGPSNTLMRSSSIILAAIAASTGAGRNTTSAIASASTPPMPSITVAPNCGSRTAPTISSRRPSIIGATSNSTSPSSGCTAPSSESAASRTASASTMPRRTRPRSVLWAIRSPLSLRATGTPSSAAAAIAPSASRTARSRASGRPNAPSNSLEARSDSVVIRQSAR